VDRAVASARKHNIDAAGNRILRKSRTRAAAPGSHNLNGMPLPAQCFGNLLDQLFAQVPNATGNRVIDEDALHTIILSRGLRPSLALTRQLAGSLPQRAQL
jgi:hypothetical protein